MEELSNEVKMEIWKDLPVKDILNLCKVSKSFQEICQDETTWRFLLRRDFRVNYRGTDPKVKYIMEYTKDELKKNKSIFTLWDTDSNNSIFSCIASEWDEVLNLIAEQYNNDQLNRTLNRIIDDSLDTKFEEEEEEITFITSDYLHNLINDTDYIIVRHFPIDAIL